MTTKPITFSAPMVRAILDGRKTQTRQAMQPQPDHVDEYGRCWSRLPNGESSFECYASPVALGDLLWVRETIICRSIHHQVPVGSPMYGRDVADAVYAADDTVAPISSWPWQRHVLPSPNVPRWASRLTLEVTDVRAERLKEISGRGAVAEGALAWAAEHDPLYADEDRTGARIAFRTLWDSIYGFGSWDANPWVWVCEFKVHRQNVERVEKVDGEQ